MIVSRKGTSFPSPPQRIIFSAKCTALHIIDDDANLKNPKNIRFRVYRADQIPLAAAATGNDFVATTGGTIMLPSPQGGEAVRDNKTCITQTKNSRPIPLLLILAHLFERIQ